MALLNCFRRSVLHGNIGCSRVTVRRVTSIATTDDYKSLKEKRKLKTEKQPFVKNLYLGKYDVEMLSYPEILEPEELQQLDSRVQNLVKFFDRKTEDRDSFNNMKSLGLFGLQVPKQYGGLDLSATEYAKYCETLSQDRAVAISVTSHQGFGLKGLLSSGTEAQKQQYLARLASGDWIAGFCFAEPQRSVHANIETEAKMSLDGDKWLINGSKILITADGKADLLTVIAKTAYEEYDGTKSEGLTAFLVERTFEGITTEKNVDIIGDKGTNLCEIHFKNTPVPLNNVLGKVGEGYKLCADILGSNRFGSGGYAVGILKELLVKSTEHCIKHSQLGKSLMDFQLIQAKLSDIVYSIYAIESITYLTAGIIDSTISTDTSVESAIVKVFSSEELFQCILTCQSILGSDDILKGSTSDSILRDSKVFMLLQGSNEILRMYIALSGLQHAGIALQEEVNKVRNPLMYPGYILKSLLERKNHASETPKLVLGLNGYLHPSLMIPSQQLEYCVIKLQHVVEILLSRHGRLLSEKEIELNRLTNIVIRVYVMTAVLARSSRSYCIGLQHSDKEVMIATAICHRFFQNVKQIVTDLSEGPYSALDASSVTIAKETFHHKGYFYEDPLKRSFS